MAYNFFPAGYQPYNVAPQPQAQSNPMNWVSGEAGAKAYLVAPNQSVILWDSEEQVIYLKSADASGMPSMKTLDYTIRDSQGSTEILPQGDFATKEDISLIKDEIEALREELKPKKTKVSER